MFILAWLRTIRTEAMIVALVLVATVGTALWFRSAVLDAERTRIEVQELRQYEDTTRGIQDEVRRHRDDSLDDARDWLRSYATE